MLISYELTGTCRINWPISRNCGATERSRNEVITQMTERAFNVCVCAGPP
jgi:hypothetical protein